MWLKYRRITEVRVALRLVKISCQNTCSWATYCANLCALNMPGTCSVELHLLLLGMSDFDMTVGYRFETIAHAEDCHLLTFPTCSSICPPVDLCRAFWIVPGSLRQD